MSSISNAHGRPLPLQPASLAMAALLLLGGCQSSHNDSWWWSWQQQEDSTADSAGTTHAPTAADVLIEKGNLALTKDQLSVPVHDNALSYYRQALRLEPENTRAQRGIRKVAKRYRTLARTAHDNGNNKLAERYLQQSENIMGVDHTANRKLRLLLEETPSGQNQRALDKNIKEEMKTRKDEAKQSYGASMPEATP